MFDFIGLILDLFLNAITFGGYGRDLGEEPVWIKGDGFGRPGND